MSDEYARIFSLQLRLTGDRDVAADLTQETFVSAYQSVHTFGGKCRPATWVYGVALNCNRNWRKRTGRHEPPDELDEDLPDPAPTAEELATLRERRELIYGAVQRLPETYRRMVALRHFAEVPTAQIAASEGVDEGTIRWRLHRAKQKLWVMLKECLGEEKEDGEGVQGRIRLAP